MRVGDVLVCGGVECLRQDFPQRDDVSKVQQTFATLIDSLCVSRQFKTTKKSVNTENETPPVTTDSPQEDQTSDNSQEVQQEPLLAPSSGPEVVAEVSLLKSFSFTVLKLTVSLVLHHHVLLRRYVLE